MHDPQIKFWGTRGKYGCFSNFSNHSVIVDSKVYPTTEHYYQSMKMISFDAHERVRTSPTPKISKQIAYMHKIREDWDDVKYKIMLFALLNKTEQHQIVFETLMDTGKKEIIENSPYDYIWGIVVKTDLGRIY